jgi:hypothetical protein
MKKQPNSLRSYGFTTLSIDNDTKSTIKQLAGDTPICEFMREMVNDYAGNKQVPLSTGITRNPVIDKLNSLESKLNTALSSLSNMVPEKDKVDSFDELVTRLELILTDPKAMFNKEYRNNKAREITIASKQFDDKLKVKIAELLDIVKQSKQTETSVFNDGIKAGNS